MKTHRPEITEFIAWLSSSPEMSEITERWIKSGRTIVADYADFAKNATKQEHEEFAVFVVKKKLKE